MHFGERKRVETIELGGGELVKKGHEIRQFREKGHFQKYLIFYEKLFDQHYFQKQHNRTFIRDPVRVSFLIYWEQMCGGNEVGLGEELGKCPGIETQGKVLVFA